jgi:hypothetical protein
MEHLVQRTRAALEGGEWLNRRRLFAYGGIILGLELLTVLFLTAGTYGWIVPLDKPTTTDFVSFYAAGALADSGSPEWAYARPEHFAAEQRATAPGISYVFFYYPPIFLLLCAALARLPYLVAFGAFEGATLAACLMVVMRIIGDMKWRGVAPLLAYPAIFINVGVGQNGLLTAALFGGATLLIDSRPLLAGLLFGAVVYKFHFGILIPVALVAGGRWRAFAAATATVVALLAASLAAFGWTTWRSFLDAIATSQTTYATGKVDFAAFANVFGALRLVGVQPVTAYCLQGVTTLAVAALVAYVWRRNVALPVRAATLTAGAVAAAPLSLFYDLVLAGVAIAWLVRDGRDNGFVKWEKTVLVGIFFIPMLSRGFGAALDMPLAWASPLALCGLCLALAQRKSGTVRLRAKKVP